MSQELLHDNSIRVTEYSLIDFTFAVADLGARGFVPTLLNGSHPEGGMGSWYTCIMVARDAYHIDKDGNHVNVPKQEAETSKETALKDYSDDVSGVGGTDVSETTSVAKTPEEAFEVRKKFKQNEMKKLAKKYQGVLDERVIHKLENFDYNEDGITITPDLVKEI